MKKLLLLTLLLFSALNAKVLYLSYANFPERVVKGEVFSVTIKTISTVKDFSDIHYTFQKFWGVKPLNFTPKREIQGQTYLETFQFLATSNEVRLPDITAKLIAPQEHLLSTLNGKKITSIALNPKQDFSKIVANSFELLEYKTTPYDIKHNIVIFTASAQNSNLKAIRFKNVYKQGIESLTETYVDPKVTYFVIIDKKLERFQFSYFSLLSNKFEKVIIPIVVVDDSVTTQTDLKPKDHSKEALKVNIAGGVAIVIFLLAIWRKKYIYLILVLFPISYIAYIVVPSKEVCINAGSNIHLLPVHNGTIFETTSSQYTLVKEGTAQGFVKVKLENEKIGWVKNENICAP